MAGPSPALFAKGSVQPSSEKALLPSSMGLRVRKLVNSDQIPDV